MSANPIAVWKGNYNSDDYPIPASEASCGIGKSCDSVALAGHDQQRWSSQLSTFLPNPKASIQCSGVDSVGYDPTAQLNMRPPYGGSCKMTISWSEQGAGDENHRGTTMQTFAWKFQP